MAVRAYRRLVEPGEHGFTHAQGVFGRSLARDRCQSSPGANHEAAGDLMRMGLWADKHYSQLVARMASAGVAWRENPNVQRKKLVKRRIKVIGSLEAWKYRPLAAQGPPGFAQFKVPSDA